MTDPKFDEARLERARYDHADPLSMGTFMRTSYEFMELVRQDAFKCPEDTPLLDKFCKLVDSKAVWKLAQMVVPEFRSAAALPNE